MASDTRRKQRPTEEVSPQLPMPGAGPEAAAASKEVGQRVELLLAKLEPERREVLLLVDVEGYSVPEVASATGVNLNTLYTRLRAARQQFEDLVKTRGRGAAMKPLSKEASAALSALKANDPTADDEARVRQNLERALGVAIPAAGLAVATTATTAQAAGAGAGLSGGLASLGVGAKVLLVVAAIGVGSVVTIGVKSSLSSRGGEGRGEEAKPKPALLAKAEPPAPEIEIEQTPAVEKNAPRRSGPLTVQQALESAKPKNVKITALGEKGGVSTLSGTAATFDDVSEFMRALNNLVCSPKGLGRIVERKKGGGLFMVEPLEAAPVVLEWSTRDLGFIFANTQLKSTERVEDGNEVMFSLTLGVDLSLCNGAPAPVRPPLPQLALAPTPDPAPGTEAAPLEPSVTPEAASPPPPSAETYAIEVESNFPDCDAATELRSALTARRLLTADRAEEAVWLLGAYQRRCPSGRWSDEAWSVRMAGLCRLGRNAEVIGLLQWFSAEYPARRAAVVTDLRSSCSEEVLKHGEAPAE